MMKDLEQLPKDELLALDGLSAAEVFAYLESKGFEPYWFDAEDGYAPDPRVVDDCGNDWLFGCDEYGSFIVIEVMNDLDDQE